MPWVSLACGRETEGLPGFLSLPLFQRREPGPTHNEERLVSGPRRVNYTCFLTPRPSLIHLLSHSIVITELAICQALEQGWELVKGTVIKSSVPTLLL